MYRPLNDIANDVATALENTEIFKSVDTAAVTSGEQLYKAAANLKIMPAAVVCIGDGDFQQYGTIRNFSVIIVVFAQFAASQSRKAANAWTLLEKAAQPFLPVFEEGQPPLLPVINDIQYEVKGWAPVNGDKSIAAFSLELDAVEIFKI